MQLGSLNPEFGIKVILVIIILFFVLVSFQAVRIFHFAKISKKLIEETKAFSFKNTNAAKKFLIIGDSLAVGVGGKETESLGGRLHADYPEASIQNLSVSGAKIEDGLKIINQIGESEKFDVIIIQLGANDITQQTPISKVIEGATQILKKAKMLSNKVIFLTSGSVGYAPIFIKPSSYFLTYRSTQFFKLFKEISAENRVTFIDLFHEKENDPFLKNINLYYAKDYFHPSGEGYGIWYKVIKEYIS